MMEIHDLVEHLRTQATAPMNDALLLALGELIRKEVSAEQVLVRIVDVMAEVLRADRGTIFWVDRATDELVSVVAHLPEVAELRIPLSAGLAGYVARTGEVVNIPDSADDERFWPQADAATGYRTRTMLAGPLRDDQGRIIGVVQLLNKRDGVFDGRDEAMLMSLADEAARLLKETTLNREVRFLGEASDAVDDDIGLGEQFNRVLGRGAAMRTVLRQVRKVASAEITVLLRGESGTGKTHIARAIHNSSKRARGPFVVVDCTTLPQTLIENELFGHERGAFTGADTRTQGKVVAAHGGTIFLDEVGDLPLEVQGKLLTLLQDRTFSRVGAHRVEEADVRIVAATNRDLESLMREGRFREDLYYRLRVAQIEMPPLRERGRDDLMRLIDHFLGEAAHRHGRAITSITPAALAALMEHPWPGNVRELENTLEAAVIFSEGGRIDLDGLSLPRGTSAGRDEPSPWDDEPTLAELEARYIAHLLRRYDGNRSECARILNIGRNTLHRKLKKYDLE